MTLLAHPRAVRLRPGRLHQRPESIAVLSGVAAFLLHLVAAWPGWLLPAGVGQLTQARTGPYTDAYPAGLTWAWAQMDPAGRGPFVPFLLQLFLFWLGVVLLTIGLQPAARWTRFIPLLVLLNPLTWSVAVVSPPSAMVSVVALAVGVGSIGLRRVRAGYPTDGRIAVLVAAALLGFGALGGGILTWFVIPLLMLLSAALALAVLPRQIGARLRLETTAKAVLLTFVASLVAAVALPLIVIGNVAPTRSHEAFYALDAFHVDCAATWSTGRVAAEPVSPQGLWVDGSAPCNEGTPGDFGTAWAGSVDPSSPQVLDLGTWAGFALQHPGVVVGGRLQHATAMLTADYPVPPAIDGGELVAAPAAVGAGAAAGEPSRGGILLAMAAAVTALLPGAPLLWTLLIPAGVAVWWVRRLRAQAVPVHAVAVLPLLVWPPLAGLVLGMATPFDDATVIAPAAVLGWVFSLWAVALAGVDVGERNLEQIRYGGPYPGTVQVEDAAAGSGGRPRLPVSALRRGGSRLAAPVVGVRRLVRHRGPAVDGADLGPSPLSHYVAEHAGEFEDAHLEKVP